MIDEITNIKRLFLMAALISLPCLPAQAVNLNYERLSSLEQALAVQYSDVTFLLTGLSDASFDYIKGSSRNDSDVSVLGNFQISAETQLANSWTFGAVYFGQYDESSDDHYNDNAALYLGGAWGTGAVGNVKNLLKEQTRRARGAGNADLKFDDHLGQFSDVGANYIGRFGPSQLLATVDDSGNFEIASIYQRPFDNRDYRISISYRESEFTPDSETISFDSKAITLVGELTYGSTVLDASIGVERLAYNAMSVARRTLSLGASRKLGVWTFSGEVHFGDTQGQDEASYALGLKYDIARGMSLNLGLNHSDADVNFNGIDFINAKQTQGLASLRYSF